MHWRVGSHGWLATFSDETRTFLRSDDLSRHLSADRQLTCTICSVLMNPTLANHAGVLRKEFMQCHMTSNRWNLQLCEPFSDSVPPKPESKVNAACSFRASIEQNVKNLRTQSADTRQHNASFAKTTQDNHDAAVISNTTTNTTTNL
jgi:hypothetical protein